MSNETLAPPDPTVFVAVFNQNWDNARHIKSERISFMTAFSLVSAGVRPCSKTFEVAPWSKSPYFYS